MDVTTATGEIGLADMLVRLSHLVQNVFTDVSRCHELTPQQAQLLCRLARGPVGMAELSRSLHLEKSSLTGLVDRVERRGLVARLRSSRDRRACQIALTSEGSRLAEASHRDICSRLDALAAALQPSEQARLAAAVGRILASAGTPASSPRPTDHGLAAQGQP